MSDDMKTRTHNPQLAGLAGDYGPPLGKVSKPAEQAALCQECGNNRENPREDSIERLLVCGSSFHEQPAPGIDTDDPPTCALCEEEYWLRDGMDPSKYCDPCAQTRVSDLETMLKRLRDFIEFGPFYGIDATNIVMDADKVLKPINRPAEGRPASEPTPLSKNMKACLAVIADAKAGEISGLSIATWLGKRRDPSGLCESLRGLTNRGLVVMRPMDDPNDEYYKKWPNRMKAMYSLPKEKP